MKYFKTLGLVSVLAFGIAIMFGSGSRPNSTPPSPTTISIEASTTMLPDRILPGCVSELVGQTLTLPTTEITFDVDGIIDRVGVVVPVGAMYNYSLRPVNPLNCSPTSLPALPSLAISFGFNYLGDFSRANPLCMNASTIELTDFAVTETPFDSIIELAAHGIIWMEVDRSIANRLHPLHIGGTRPANIDPRCSNWVDLTTLPIPG